MNIVLDCIFFDVNCLDEDVPENTIVMSSFAYNSLVCVHQFCLCVKFSEMCFLSAAVNLVP